MNEWFLQEPEPDHTPAQLSTVATELNTALNLALEVEDKAFIDKIVDHRVEYIRNVSEVKNIVNAIWVAHFGDDAYEGYIAPSVVLKWAERTGIDPILSLDVAIQPLLEWVEGRGCPDVIIKPVKRSLEKYAP